MLIFLVKSVLNRWDSMPVVLDVRVKGRLSHVGIGEGSRQRQERYAATQGVLPQCGMQHGAQEMAAEGSGGAAQTQLPMGCRERGHRPEASRPDFGVH